VKIFSFSPKYIFFLLLPFLFPACGSHKSRKNDPDYVPARVRKEKRKQQRIVENYKAEFDSIKARYAYEERLQRSLEKKNLQEKEKEEAFAKELKKIMMLKASASLSPTLLCAGGLGTNNAPFLAYKNILESDLKTLQQESAAFMAYEWHSEYENLLNEMQTFIAKLDAIYDIIFLDVDTVRDAQMVAMNAMIKQLESENYDLEKQLQSKKDQPVTVVINSAQSSDEDA